MQTSQKTNILTVRDVCKSFKKDRTQEMLVLKEINFTLNEGEIVALLGKSGSGKSTLLRIIAGLIRPSSGEIVYRGRPVLGPARNISMVFQHFALMPWLTVLQNVELGLEALGVPRDERRTRALKAIDTVGLDGFESALPKELSGGMCQRVGFARAIVVNPDVLLMDEPFSALDVLTADNLRSDLMDLWKDKKTNTNGIIFVTHNIEEAAALADRIIIFNSDPGTIRAELQVELKQPRDDQDQSFRKLVDDIYTLMTTSMTTGAELAGTKYKDIGIGYRLPDIEISELIGLLETVDAEGENGRMDLPELAESTHKDIDELFPLTEVLELMRFGNVSKGDIEINADGRRFVELDILERKKVFAHHLIAYVPLAKHIRRVLDERPGHRADEERFLRELEDHLSEDEAERVLRVAIDWGRYAEIFAYDYNSGSLSLENPS